MSAGTILGLIFTLGLVLLGLVLGALIGPLDDGRGGAGDGAAVGGALGAIGCVVFGAVWLIFAGPVSTYNRNTCERIADGYGLEEIDWSFRNDCRLYLPTGQLVPEGRLRVTETGEFLIVGDE